MASRRTTIGSSKTTRSTIGAKDPGSKGANEPRRFNWEESTFEDAHASFLSWADHVREQPAYQDRRKWNLLYASLYANRPLLGFGANSYTRAAPSQGRISLNALQNAIDSLVSKVCKNRPRPMFQTSEADYELREQAENADYYVDGLNYRQHYYTDTYPGKVLDACLYGLGITKNHEVDGEALCERTYPWCMIFDDRELMHGRPFRTGERKYYDVQVAFDRWRKHGKGDKEWNADLQDVLDSQVARDGDEWDIDRDESSQQVVVYEGWRDRTSSSGPARIVCVRGKTLEFEKETKLEIPYVYLRPKVQSIGFWGIGCCERVYALQGEINRIVRDIQQAMHLIAKPHWMVETSSNVNTASLNNDIATIIKYTGAVPPTVYTPQSMSAEVFQHLQFLVRTLYEVLGVSQLSASSQKPAGLNAAVAIRTYLNTETEYFNDFVRMAEESAAEDARKRAKILGSMKEPKAVMARSSFQGRTIPKVNWKPLDLDSIAVQVYPTSKLPDTPAGRREYALELAQYTRVTTDDIFEMLEWGDTEAFARRRLAGKKNVEKDIMKIRRGEKVIRDAIGDHRMAFSMMTDAYEEAKHDELPQPRLAMMRTYIKACFWYLTGKEWNEGGPNELPPPPGPEALMPPPPPPVVPPGMMPPPMPGPAPGPMNGAPPAMPPPVV